MGPRSEGEGEVGLWEESRDQTCDIGGGFKGTVAAKLPCGVVAGRYNHNGFSDQYK